jgi:hypothetical protein
VTIPENVPREPLTAYQRPGRPGRLSGHHTPVTLGDAMHLYDHDPLASLVKTYPAFRFNLRTVGRHGDCWIAERKDGLTPGLHTIITADLEELRAALASQEGTPGAR